MPGWLSADIVTSIATAVLVAVTAWYAYLTNKIARASKEAGDTARVAADIARQSADAAKQSAEAATAAVEEMHRQRLRSSQPLILPVAFDVSGVAGYQPSTVAATLKNLGNGPAIFVNARLFVNDVVYTDTTNSVRLLPAIAADEQVETRTFAAPNPDQRYIEPRDHQAKLELWYQDIYYQRFWIWVRFTIHSDSGSHIVTADETWEISNTPPSEDSVQRETGSLEALERKIDAQQEHVRS